VAERPIIEVRVQPWRASPRVIRPHALRDLASSGIDGADDLSGGVDLGGAAGADRGRTAVGADPIGRVDPMGRGGLSIRHRAGCWGRAVAAVAVPLLLLGLAAVDEQLRAVDEARLRGRQEHGRSGDLGWVAQPAERDHGG
jgi:hypothetical protein